MDWLVTVSLAYMFVAIYFLFFFLILYFRNKDLVYSYPVAKRRYSISILVPAYNEEESVGSTVENLFKSDYPIKEVIVIDDGSRDGTAEIIRNLMKKYKNLRLLSKQNSGKADSINQALKIARGELIGVVDADSYPQKDAIRKMVGYFDDSEVGAATSSITPIKREKFIEKLQAFEYVGIAFTRKLLDYLDAIFVTPGALSLYRKSAVIKAGGFDPKNITEDIEIAWHLIHNGYKVRMSLPSKCYTLVPTKFKQWKKQRIRWGVGGLQTLWKYRADFLKKEIFGFFIIPFVFVSIFLGLFAFILGWYLIIKNFVLTYLYAKYSFAANTPLVTFGDLNVAPSVIIIYIVFLFLAGFCFTVFSLGVMKEKELKKVVNRNIFNLLFYMLVYLGFYYVIWIISIWKVAVSKNIRWGTK